MELYNSASIYSSLKIRSVKIDFENLFKNNGVIALIGENGTGKSSILDACHPYKELLLRGERKSSPSFESSFLPEGGYKKVVYEINKDVYEFKIEVKKSGTKHYIFKNGKSLLENTLAGPYNDAVKQIFGPVDVFLSTNLRNSNFAYLSHRSEAEQRRHFLDMLGYSRFEIIKDKASKKAKENDGRILELQTKINVLEDKIKDLSDESFIDEIDKKTIELNNIIALKERFLKERDDIISTNTMGQERQRSLEAAKEKLEQLQNSLNSLEEINTQHLSEISIDEKENEKINIERDKKENKKQEKIKELDELNETIKILLVNKKQITEDFKDLEEKNQQLRDIEKQIQSLISFENERIKITNKIDSLKIQIEAHSNKIYKELTFKKLDEDVKEEIKNSIKEPKEFLNKIGECVKEELFEEDIEKIVNFQKEKEKYEQNLSNISDKVEQYNILQNEKTKISEKIDKYETNDIREKYKKINDYLLLFSDLNSEILVLTTEIRVIDSNIEQIIIKINNKKGKIKENEERIKEIQIEISSNKSLIDNNENITIKDENELKVKIQELEEKETNINKEKYKLEIDFKAFQEVSQEKQLVEKELNLLNIENNDWKEIAQAYNQKSGIPILKLEEAIPKIEKKANNILKDVLDGFTVRFDTKKTKSTKSTKKTKDEDVSFTFKIMVEKKDGFCIPLQALSGGEKVQIEAAIALSSIIYTQSVAKRKLSVMFLDESDGPLDNMNLDKFFVMIQKAHAEAGCKQTIFITHRLEHLPADINKIILKKEKGFKIEIA